MALPWALISIFAPYHSDTHCQAGDQYGSSPVTISNTAPKEGGEELGDKEDRDEVAC